MVQCSVRSPTNRRQIHLTSLLDTGATGIAFVDVAMARHVCDVLQISFIPLAKSKPVRGFDGRPAPDITHAIYPTLTVQGHFELLAPMLMTKLGQHPLILDKPWMQKHGVIIDLSCDKITFWPGHCQHSTIEKELRGIALAPKPSEPIGSQEKTLARESGKIVSESSPKENFKRILPRGDIPHTNSGVHEPKEGVPPGAKILGKKLDAKLKRNKKTRTKNLPELLPHVLPNARGYRCVSKLAEEPPPKYVVPQRRLTASPTASSSTPVPSDVSKPEEKPLQLAMIGAAPFAYLAKQKDVEIFAISMRDIEYQLNKDERPPTDPATKVPECYHEFLDVFSKEASNTVSAHSKHDHVIRLLSEKDHGQAALRAMPKEKLVFVKKFLEDNLKKGFIEASSAPCSSPIMLAVKSGGGIRFCVDYRKLNELTKKDAYPIPLIAETLAQLSHARVFTKIDIWQAFHKLRMAAESEDLTTMITRFGAYKWKVLPFGLTGEST